MSGDSKDTGGFSKDRVEHLKMIQGTVIRMAVNSAQMKISVSLVATASIVSGLSKNSHGLVGMGAWLGACLLIGIFWFLDAKYLYLERRYRALYQAVINGGLKAGGSVEPFNLNSEPYKKSVGSFLRVACSGPVWSFYGALLVAMALVAGKLCLLAMVAVLLVLFFVISCYFYFSPLPVAQNRRIR